MRLFFVMFSLAGSLITAAAGGVESDSLKVEGVVKAIAVNDEIKIVLSATDAEKSSGEKIVKFCSNKFDDDKVSLLESETMELFRQAMRTGQRIRVSYQSFFNHCLSDVAVLQ